MGGRASSNDPLFKSLCGGEPAADDKSVESIFGDNKSLNCLIRDLGMRHVAFYDIPAVQDNGSARIPLPKNSGAVRRGGIGLPPMIMTPRFSNLLLSKTVS